jgi:hypothetical protein|tara:strand:- start:2081 stop:2758 length:678 start_codon:yes stop_codon:yes gene_type:complete
MDAGKYITEQDIANMRRLLDQEESDIEQVLIFLKNERWIPKPTIDRAKRIIGRLLGDKFSPEQINDFITAAGSDSLTPPGNVIDTVAFFQWIDELAHIRYAVSLGQDKGLLVLAGEQASIGQKFRDSQSAKAKKPRGKLGVSYDSSLSINEVIQLLISRNSKDTSASELWNEFYGELDKSHLDPKEIGNSDQRKAVYEYAFNDKRKTISYGRFANVVSDIKNKSR